MRALSAAAAVTCALVACYDFHFEAPADAGGSSGDGASSGDRDASSVVEVDSSAPDDADARAFDCVAGGYYCGGERLPGATDTLYRCNAGAPPTLVAKCAGGCGIQPGKNDACRPTSPCVPDGAYCGGEKVNGDPAVLYRCGPDSVSLSVIRRCERGCQINPGANDDCAP